MQQEGFIDNELVQGFVLLGYSGALDVCHAEVEAVEWVPFEKVWCILQQSLLAMWTRARSL